MDVRHALKSVVLGMPPVLWGGRPLERAGEGALAKHVLGFHGRPRMTLVSEVFLEAGQIPVRYTADGKNESPPLVWAKAPSAALSLALLVEDPDAGTPAPFLHWLVYGISPLRQRLPPGIPPFGVDFIEQGLNSTLRRGYAGCAPPRGDRPHRYVFELFALDTPLPVPAGAGRGRVLRAMRGHVCAYGELMGTYARPP